MQIFEHGCSKCTAENDGCTYMTILLALPDEHMNGFGVRQYAGLLLSASMVILGYMGLTKRVTTESVLIAAILVTVAVLSFSLGYQAAELEST